MSDLYWLTEDYMARLRLYFPRIMARIKLLPLVREDTRFAS